MAGEARRQRLRALLALAGAANADVKKIESAFVHESAVREGLARHSNERLEFLGDAVLGLAVARALYERYPAAAEGELALRKAALVSDAALAETAERLEFDPLLVLGAGLANAPAGRRRSVLADAFEAFLAALYRDAGFAAVSDFVMREHVAVRERSAAPLHDSKSVLQEWTQKRYAATPAYSERFEGDGFERVFFAEVAVAGETLARGSGSSKKAAQREAAERALEVLAARHGDVKRRELSVAVAPKKPRGPRPAGARTRA